MAKKVKKTSKKTASKKKSAKKNTAKKTSRKKTTKKKASKKKTSKKTAKKKTAKKKAKKTKIKKTKKSTKNKAKKKKSPKKKAVSTRKTYLSKKQLEHFRDLLLIKRSEIIGDVSSMENEALRRSRLDAAGDLSSMPIHMADMGTDNYEQEFALGLMGSERKLLEEINLALDRIYSGVYGLCMGTHKPIPKARLEANPWARYCVEYATMVEKGQVIEGEKLYDEEEDEEEDFEEEDEMIDVFEEGDQDEIEEDEENSDRRFDLMDFEDMDEEEEENY